MDAVQSMSGGSQVPQSMPNASGGFVGQVQTPHIGSLQSVVAPNQEMLSALIANQVPPSAGYADHLRLLQFQQARQQMMIFQQAWNQQYSFTGKK
jgi:hypothetical protein